jgi:hypothetical protein
MHVLHALPHDITGRCMQLLHGLCCFDFISDILIPPATLKIVVFPALVSNKSWVFWLSGFWAEARNKESLMRLYSVR